MMSEVWIVELRDPLFGQPVFEHRDNDGGMMFRMYILRNAYVDQMNNLRWFTCVA
jgi:hypothetical protein